MRPGGPPRHTRLIIYPNLDATGRRSAYYRHAGDEGGAPASGDKPFSSIVDALLTTNGGELRRALGLEAHDWQRFATRLMGQVFDHHDGLLPPALGHLLVRDARLIAYARTQAADQWTIGRQDYVRLRHP